MVDLSSNLAYIRLEVSYCFVLSVMVEYSLPPPTRLVSWCCTISADTGLGSSGTTASLHIRVVGHLAHQTADVAYFPWLIL
jgi:hypothetical protein